MKSPNVLPTYAHDIGPLSVLLLFNLNSAFAGFDFSVNLCLDSSVSWATGRSSGLRRFALAAVNLGKLCQSRTRLNVAVVRIVVNNFYKCVRTKFDDDINHNRAVSSSCTWMRVFIVRGQEGMVSKFLILECHSGCVLVLPIYFRGPHTARKITV